jgi:hypothetical protein
MKMDITEIGLDGSGIDSYGLGQRQMVGCSNCGKACLDFLKCREFLDYLKNC